jgi:hypothetical protein
VRRFDEAVASGFFGFELLSFKNEVGENVPGVTGRVLQFKDTMKKISNHHHKNDT